MKVRDIDDFLYHIQEAEVKDMRPGEDHDVIFEVDVPGRDEPELVPGIEREVDRMTEINFPSDPDFETSYKVIQAIKDWLRRHNYAWVADERCVVRD